MANYIGVPLETDPDDLANEVFDELQAEVSGWVPSDGAMDTRLINSFAGLSAETRDLASAVPDTIFATFGAAFMNLPQIQGNPAQILSTWTARDNLGYTIPQGTLVQGIDNTGVSRFWSVYQDYVIAPAATSVSGVILQALDNGVDANNITYLSGQVTLVDDLEFISGLVTNSSSGGGVDPEADQDYLNRLRALLQLLSLRPILAPDFSIIAENYDGVGRATTLDGYDPTSNTYNNAREVTVYVVDDNGNDPGGAVRSNLASYLASLREVNFIVNVRAPLYVSVDISYIVIAGAGIDHTQLQVDIQAALALYINQANWGVPDVGEGAWSNVTKVYYSRIMALIQDVIGVDHVSMVAINGSSTDYNLGTTGPVVLPNLGTVTASIS